LGQYTETAADALLQGFDECFRAKGLAQFDCFADLLEFMRGWLDCEAGFPIGVLPSAEARCFHAIGPIPIEQGIVMLAGGCCGMSAGA